MAAKLGRLGDALSTPPPHLPGLTHCIQIQTLASNLIAFLGDLTALPHSGLYNLHVQFLNKAV